MDNSDEYVDEEAMEAEANGIPQNLLHHPNWPTGFHPLPWFYTSRSSTNNTSKFYCSSFLLL